MIPLILTLSLLATPVAIEVDVHYLPDGERITLKSGKTAQAYELGAFKKLLQIDADLWGKTQQLSICDKALATHTLALHESAYITDLLWEDLEIMRTRSSRIEDNWLQCEEQKVGAWSAWPYVVGGVGLVVGAIGLGFGIGSSL